MGLGIYVKGEIDQSLNIKEHLLQSPAIVECITERSAGLFKSFLSFLRNDNSLEVTLHPSEEPLYFEIFDDHLICSAKTNSVGPGYHAYLVKLIEQLAIDLKITWTWDKEEGDNFYQDETGYQQEKDYKQLQTEMVRWLRALCRHYEEGDDNNQIMVSMPGGYPRIKWEYFALSPLGTWEREWFEKVSALEPEDLHWAGKEFFIWWNEEPNAEFYKRTGIALLNVDCPWHFPADDQETKLFEIINQCFEQARRVDPFIDLPDEDWTTVKDFLGDSDVDIPDTAYGYRKHLMTFDLAGNWMIDLQGTMYHTIDEDTEVYYDHERTVRSLAYLLPDQRQSDEEYAENFFNKNDHAAGAEVIYSTTDLAGKAIIYYAIDGESEYWILQGVRVGDSKFLLSTICYPTEEHKEWAIETWNSVRKSSINSD